MNKFALAGALLLVACLALGLLGLAIEESRIKDYRQANEVLWEANLNWQSTAAAQAEAAYNVGRNEGLAKGDNAIKDLIATIIALQSNPSNAATGTDEVNPIIWVAIIAVLLGAILVLAISLLFR